LKVDPLTATYLACMVIGSSVYGMYMIQQKSPSFFTSKRIVYVACGQIMGFLILMEMKVLPSFEGDFYSMVNYAGCVAGLLVIGMLRRMNLDFNRPEVKGKIVKDGENPFFVAIPEWEKEQDFADFPTFHFQDAYEEMIRNGVFG